jgi:hypothetical protein
MTALFDIIGDSSSLEISLCGAGGALEVELEKVRKASTRKWNCHQVPGRVRKHGVSWPPSRTDVRDAPPLILIERPVNNDRARNGLRLQRVDSLT